MKKKLTLILSLVLALSMCFCLVSCGEDTKGSSDDTSKVQSEEIKDGASTPALEAESSEVVSVEEVSIIGSWKGQIDYSEFFNSMLNTMMGGMMGDESAQYFDVKGFKLDMLYTFNEDDTYTCLVDEDSVNDAMESIKPGIKDGYVKFIEDVIEMAQLEMTVDEYLALTETDLDASVDDLIAGFDTSTFAIDEQGTYEIEGDKLFTTDEEDGENDDESYMVFELTADTLTFVSGTVNEDEINDPEGDIGINKGDLITSLMDSLFPMVFNKV